MSLSATQSGTTRRSEGSGRSFGVAAAVLAVLIAVAVVYTVNQGNEATVSNPETGSVFVSNTDGLSELKRLNEMAARAGAAAAAPVDVRVSGEEILAELNEIAEAVARARAESYPGFNPEATKIQNGQISDRTGASTMESRLQHEYLEEQRDGDGPNGSGNPLEGLAE